MKQPLADVRSDGVTGHYPYPDDHAGPDFPGGNTVRDVITGAIAILAAAVVLGIIALAIVAHVG